MSGAHWRNCDWKSPASKKKDMDVHLENDVLRVEGRIEFGNYEGLEPLYTEYNVGHFARAFALSSNIDQQQISAKARGWRPDADAQKGAPSLAEAH